MAVDLRPQDLKPERIDTYKDWQAEQKIPVVRGFFVEDVNKVELEYWDLKGVPCSLLFSTAPAAPTTRTFARSRRAARPSRRNICTKRWST